MSTFGREKIVNNYGCGGGDNGGGSGGGGGGGGHMIHIY